MTYFDFQTTAYGKWILVGEHAVLRGNAALVFPIFSKTMILSYLKSESFQIFVEGEHDQGMHALFKQVILHGALLINKDIQTIQGQFYIDNTIPIGVGMGASAALCVVVARWFLYKGWIKEENLFEFAKELEHLFHGKSSGLDIVGASAAGGCFFQNGTIQTIAQSWPPYWLLSYCGTKGMTSDCIHKVQYLWEMNPTSAQLIDMKMNESVEKARESLILAESSAAFSLLKESINLARECFCEWGLINDSLNSHMHELIQFGAEAVKPTGSGGGGYVLSLWSDRDARDKFCYQDLGSIAL